MTCRFIYLALPEEESAARRQVERAGRPAPSSTEEITMSDRVPMTGRLIAAARVLSGVSQMDLANTSGLSLATLATIEAEGSAPLQSATDAEALTRALESFGTIFIPEGNGIGAGVRLKFLRQDVSQILRMENEGGIVKNDDVP
jgi:transcriptional regulator with XRE-family HTH domain